MVTTHFLNRIMGNVFGTQKDPLLPTEYYIGLSSAEPQLDGSGAKEPSTSNTGYARVKLSSLSAPDNGKISNTADVTFPTSTQDWGRMTHFVIFDAATAGNLLCYDALTKPRTIESESVLTFKTGELSITLENKTA